MGGISNDLTISGSHTWYNKDLPPAPILGIPTVQPTNMPDVNLRSNQDMLSQLGMSPDFLDKNKIYGLLAQGAGSSLAQSLNGVQASRNSYASDVRGQQSGYIDALRKANAGAIQSGASRGTLAAQELSSMLGLQQQTVNGLTPLAQQEQAAYAQYGQALASALSGSESTAFDRSNALAALASALYEYDSDRASTKYAADTSLKGTIYNALQNAYADRYAADQNQRTQWGSLASTTIGGANTTGLSFDPMEMLTGGASMLGSLGSIAGLFL